MCLCRTIEPTARRRRASVERNYTLETIQKPSVEVEGGERCLRNAPPPCSLSSIKLVLFASHWTFLIASLEQTKRLHIQASFCLRVSTLLSANSPWCLLLPLLLYVSWIRALVLCLACWDVRVLLQYVFARVYISDRMKNNTYCLRILKNTKNVYATLSIFNQIN